MFDQGTKRSDFSPIYSHYFTAGGLSGLDGYLRNDKPRLLHRLWVTLCIWFILPQVTLTHLYTALFTDIPVAQRFLSMSLGLDQLQITIKCHYMLRNLPRFRNVMLDLETFNCVNYIGAASTLNNFATACKLMKWLRNTFNFACYFTFVAWTMFPLVSTPQALFLGVDLDAMMKVLPPKYPFATNYFPMAQLIYVLESLSTFVILTYFASTNLIIVTDTLLICQLFKILSKSLALTEVDKPMDLRSFAVDHQKLLKISSDLRDLLSPVLALQLGVSLITISLAVFEITMVNEAQADGSLDHLVLMSRKSSYTLIIFIELLLFCWLSTELQIACTEIRDGVYHGDWYLNNLTQYKDMIMINMRSLKPVRLRALNIVTLHLGTSLEVLRLAYTYYTYLKRLR